MLGLYDIGKLFYITIRPGSIAILQGVNDFTAVNINFDKIEIYPSQIKFQSPFGATYNFCAFSEDSAWTYMGN